MTELNIISVDNETLRREYDYFLGIRPKGSSNQSFRDEYCKELKKVFDASDQKHDGKIDRKEFEFLIKGYFELKGIQSTQENYDEYFKKLDIKQDHCITIEEFINFMDQVIEKDILPFLREEMQNRNML